MKIKNICETVIGNFPILKESGVDLMWNKGASSIAMISECLYIALPEISEDKKPLCNVRWKIYYKNLGDKRWEEFTAGNAFNEREPFPVGVCNSKLLLSVNPSVDLRRKRPNGIESWYTRPELFLLDSDNCSLTEILPVWNQEYDFFEHSYRGLAVDKENSTIFISQQAPYEKERYGQAWCYIDTAGKTLANGLFKFPQRGCYPVISMHKGEVAALFDSDIVEPNEEYRKIKLSVTHREWDYVFSNIHLFHSQNILNNEFGECVTVDSVEDSAGILRTLDSWQARDGSLFVLYHKTSTHWPFNRDRFFPGKLIEISLELAEFSNGNLLETKCLIKSDDQLKPWSDYNIKKDKIITSPDIWTVSPHPKCGRLWSPDNNKLYLITSEYDNKNKRYENHLQQILPVTGKRIHVPLKTPLAFFQMPSTRNGCESSGKAVLYGVESLTPSDMFTARCVEFEISFEDID